MILLIYHNVLRQSTYHFNTNWLFGKYTTDLFSGGGELEELYCGNTSHYIYKVDLSLFVLDKGTSSYSIRADMAT